MSTNLWLMILLALSFYSCKARQQSATLLEEEVRSSNILLDRTNSYSRGKDDFPKERQFQTAIIDLSLMVVNDQNISRVKLFYRANVTRFSPEAMIPERNQKKGSNEYVYGLRQRINQLNPSFKNKDTFLKATSNGQTGSFLDAEIDLGVIDAKVKTQVSGELEVSNLSGVLIEADSTVGVKEVLGSKGPNQMIRWQLSFDPNAKLYDGGIDLEQLDGRERGLKSEDLLRLIKSNYIKDPARIKQPFTTTRPPDIIPPLEDDK